MRAEILLVLAFYAVAGTPIAAATIIQNRNVSGDQPFEDFSSSSGMLNSVTLDVTARTYRQFFVNTPAGSPPNTITYSINSYFDLISNPRSSPLAGVPLQVSTQGGGSLVQNNGVFGVSSSGAGTFDLAPLLFIDVAPFTLQISDPGLYTASESGTTISSSVPATLFQTLGDCGFGSVSTLCGQGRATLTFDFTPASAVPETATWAMMIIGFGAAGYSMRRRKANVRLSYAV